MENSEPKVTNIQPGITPIATLRSYSDGRVIELPPFSEGQRFFARIRRPSLLRMAQAGIIPNKLLNVVTKLFTTGESVDQDDPASLTDMFELTEIMVKACLAEPTWEELKEAGIELTDDQLTYIFQYAQSGVDKMSTFRSDGENNVNNRDGETV